LLQIKVNNELPLFFYFSDTIPKTPKYREAKGRLFRDIIPKTVQNSAAAVSIPEAYDRTEPSMVLMVDFIHVLVQGKVPLPISAASLGQVPSEIEGPGRFSEAMLQRSGFWFGTNEKDWADTLKAMEGRKGVYFGTSYGGQNLSRLVHGDFDLAMIVDSNPFISEIFIPIRNQMIREAKNRAHYLSLLTGVPLTESEVKKMENEPLENIHSELFKKISTVGGDRGEVALALTRNWDKMILELGLTGEKGGAATRFRDRSRKNFFGLGDMIKGMKMKDREGRGSWLASEENFQKVKKMVEAGKVLSMTGDWRDRYFMKSIASDLEAKGLKTSVIYSSNINELVKTHEWDQIIQNLKLLPIDSDAIHIVGILYGERPGSQIYPVTAFPDIRDIRERAEAEAVPFPFLIRGMPPSAKPTKGKSLGEIDGLDALRTQDMIRAFFGNRKLRILDIGAFDGIFESQFRDSFPGIVEEFASIDDGSMWGPREEQIPHKPEGVKVELISSSEAINRYGENAFDIVTLNSPQPKRWQELLQHALQLVRPTGLVILFPGIGDDFSMVLGDDADQLVSRGKERLSVKITDYLGREGFEFVSRTVPINWPRTTFTGVYRDYSPDIKFFLIQGKSLGVLWESALEELKIKDDLKGKKIHQEPITDWLFRHQRIDRTIERKIFQAVKEIPYGARDEITNRYGFYIRQPLGNMKRIIDERFRKKLGNRAADQVMSELEPIRSRHRDLAEKSYHKGWRAVRATGEDRRLATRLRSILDETNILDYVIPERFRDEFYNRKWEEQYPRLWDLPIWPVNSDNTINIELLRSWMLTGKGQPSFTKEPPPEWYRADLKSLAEITGLADPPRVDLFPAPPPTGASLGVLPPSVRFEKLTVEKWDADFPYLRQMMPIEDLPMGVNGFPIEDFGLSRTWRASIHSGFSMVARDADGTPVGFVLAGSRGLETEIIYVSHLYVHPEKQGRGIGTELLKRVGESANKIGLSAIQLNTHSKREATMKFYRGLGFEEDSEQPKEKKYPDQIRLVIPISRLFEKIRARSLGEEEAYQYLDSVKDRKEPVFALYSFEDYKKYLEAGQIEGIQKFAMQNSKMLKVIVYGVDDPQVLGKVDHVEFTDKTPAELMAMIGKRDFISLSTPAVEARKDFEGLKRQPLFFRYQSKEVGLLGMALIRVQAGRNIGLDEQDGYFVIIDEVLQKIVQKYLADLVFKIAA